LPPLKKGAAALRRGDFMRQVVLDTETTGLSPADGHRVIEIALVELQDRKLTGKTWHHYLQPEREVDAGAMRIHGITNEFLVDKPKFHDLADDFLAFIEGAELVIHNAPFDLGFLDAELALVNAAVKSLTAHCSVVDTLQIARQKYPGKKNSLDALCLRLGIDNSQRTYHGALLDTHLLVEVYLAMTGGQTSLWMPGDAASPLEAVSVQKTQRVMNPNQARTRVIHATEAELAAHQDYMEKMK
jgi:DNA polymerase III subunit epsilon